MSGTAMTDNSEVIDWPDEGESVRHQGEVWTVRRRLWKHYAWGGWTPLVELRHEEAGGIKQVSLNSIEPIN